MTHKCSACGGSGYRFAAAMIGVAVDSGAWRVLSDFPCPVCLGAGSFSDAMPIADSVADAETLRVFYRQSTSHAIYDPIYRVSCLGQTARCYIREGIEFGAHHGAVSYSVYAAHEAFNAVPGLRG